MPMFQDINGRQEISGSPADDCDIISTVVNTTYPKANPAVGFYVLADAVVQFITSGDSNQSLKPSTTYKQGSTVAIKMVQINLASGTILVHKNNAPGTATSG